MEIETIISIIGLLAGGTGVGTFFTWRYQRKKAAAEAKQAEAEAKQREAEAEKAKFEAIQAAAAATKEIQDSYQQLLSDMRADHENQRMYNDEQKQYIAELKEDRQHLREERDELRRRTEKNEEDIIALKRDVARNGRMVECMRPFLCGREGCAIRVPVTISEIGEVKQPSLDVNEQKDIEPLNMKDL